MSTARLLAIQARRFEGIALGLPEERALTDAYEQGGEAAQTLRHDEWMHLLLRDCFLLHRTTGRFVSRCTAAGSRLLAAGQSTTTLEESPPAIPSQDFPLPKIEVSRRATVQEGHGVRAGRGLPGRRRSHSAAIWLLALSGTIAAASLFLLWHAMNLRRDAAGSGLASGPVDPESPRAGRPNGLNGGWNGEAAGSSESGRTGDRIVGTAPNNAGSGTNRRTPELPVWLTSLRQSADAEWNRNPAGCPGYPVVLELRQGLAELHGAGGLKIAVRGPAHGSIDGPGQLTMRDGQFRIETGAAVGPVAIVTGPARLLQAPGSVFFADLSRDGEMLVEVESGSVSAAPVGMGDTGTLELAAGARSRALFGRPEPDASSQPLLAIASGEGGQFEGIVAVNERPLAVRQPEMLARVLELARRGLRDRPAEFAGQWQEICDGMAQASTGQFSINDLTLAAATPDELMAQLQDVGNRIFTPSGDGVGSAGGSGFSGVISINGIERRFSSREEFEAALRDMLGPLFELMGPAAAGGVRQGGGPGGEGSGATDPGGEQDRRQTGRNSGGLAFPQPGWSMQSGSQSSSDSQSMSVFDGMINRNGQSARFSSPQEFERALREMQNR